jgi:hypothetical protein
MARKKKLEEKPELEIEDKRMGWRRALVYKNKHFYYVTQEERRFALKKIAAWRVLNDYNS